MSEMRKFGLYTPPTADGPTMRRLLIEEAEFRRLVETWPVAYGRPATRAERDWLYGHVLDTPYQTRVTRHRGRQSPDALAMLQRWVAAPVAADATHPNPGRWAEYRHEAWESALREEFWQSQADAVIAGLATAEAAEGHPALTATETGWLFGIITGHSSGDAEDIPSDRVWDAYSRWATGLEQSDLVRDPRARGADIWLSHFRHLQRERDPGGEPPREDYGITLPGGENRRGATAGAHRALCADAEEAEFSRLLEGFAARYDRSATAEEAAWLLPYVVTATTEYGDIFDASRCGGATLSPSEEILAVLTAWSERPPDRVHPSPHAWESARRERYMVLRQTQLEIAATDDLIARFEARAERTATGSERAWFQHVATCESQVRLPESDVAWDVVSEWVAESPYPAAVQPRYARDWPAYVIRLHEMRSQLRAQAQMAGRAVAAVESETGTTLGDADRLWVCAQAGGPGSRRSAAVLPSSDDIAAAYRRWAGRPDPAESAYADLATLRRYNLEEHLRYVEWAKDQQVVGDDILRHTGRAATEAEMDWAWREVIFGFNNYRPPSRDVLEAAVRFFQRAEPHRPGVDPEGWEHRRCSKLDDMVTVGFIRKRDGVAQPGVG